MGAAEATRQKDSLHVNEKHSCTRFVFQGGGTLVGNHTFININTDKILFFILPSVKNKFRNLSGRISNEQNQE